MVSYIFGGDTGLTPEDIKRQREIAAALAQTSTPSNVGEGWGAIMRGLAGGFLNMRARSAETAGRKMATDQFTPILEALRNPSTRKATTDNVTTTTPDFSEDAKTSTTSTTPKDALFKALPPVEGNLANARSADRNSVQDYAGMNLKSGIKSAADALGIKPEDLATAISYETAGTFDPLKKGPTTKWGQHKGLIQFGEPQAEKYGVKWDDPLNSQLGPDGAVVKYLRDAGVKPGMELIDIYSAINAGGVNRYDASDAKNGGAWGTVADKVKYQMDGHRKKALALMADPDAKPSPFDAQPNLNKTVEQVPVVDVPPGFEQPDPLQQQQMQPVTNNQPVEVAQATQAQQTMNDGPTDEAIIQALTNPWATDEQRGIAEFYLKKRMDEREYQREQAAKLNDPKYKMELEKGRLELDNLRNPKQARTLTAEEETAAGLDPSGVYQQKPDGSIVTVRDPSKPLDAINAEKARLELDNLKSPKTAKELTADEKKTLGLPADGVYQRKPDGSIVTVREPENLDTDWAKLDGGRLFNKQTGEIKDVSGNTVGFRFPGNSPQAAALNGLIENGSITEKQAMDIAAGKQLTGPNGEIIFATPQALIGGQTQQPAQSDGIDIFAGQKPVADPAIAPVEKPAEKPADALPVMEQQNNGMIPLTAPKVTVDEKDAAGFADRMVNAGATLDKLDEFAANKDTAYDQAKSDFIPLVGNFFTSEDFKSLDQARRSFINAQLRRESGAVISPTEFENANRQYFPQPGDTPDIIEQKRKERQTAIQAMMRSAGPTYKAPKIEVPEADAKKTEAAPPADLPDEIKDAWQYMTPEERKLWQN